MYPSNIKTLLAIFFIVILLAFFYWMSLIPENKVIEEEKHHKIDFLSVLSNITDNGEVDMRIVNPITENGIIYIYCNKDTKYTFGNISLLTIIDDGRKTKQIVFSGCLSYEFDYDEYSIYKFNIKSKKKSVTTKSENNLVTQRVMNNERLNSLVFDLNVVKNIKNIIKNNVGIKVELINDTKIDHIERKINLLSPNSLN